MNTLTAGTLSESDRNSKKKYKRLVKRLTSNRDSSQRSGIDLSNDDSLCDEDSSQSEVSAEDEDLKNYVKDFRKKVLSV